MPKCGHSCDLENADEANNVFRETVNTLYVEETTRLVKQFMSIMGKNSSEYSTHSDISGSSGNTAI